LARSADDYKLALISLIADAHDTHANLWSSLAVRPPTGEGQLPVSLRFVEGRPVVTDLVVSPEVRTDVLEKGDVIGAIDGVPTDELLSRWSPYYAASNEPTRLREIADSMGRGPVGPVRVHVQRGDEEIDVNAARYPNLKRTSTREHDLAGPAFQLLSKDVAYLKLSSVKVDDCSSYVEQAKGTKGWIIDARNYPSEFVVFSLGSHLVDKPTEFVRFTVGVLSDPGTFEFTNPLSLKPLAPHYSGKVVILVDETTQSQAEYTTMALRSAPEAKVIGSTTAGADGNVSRISLPGDMQTMISGIGIFYPGKRPTQLVGIVPDFEMKPTIAGIRAGRDEVLEEALKRILGAQSASEVIDIMTAHRL
jgi:C-terminal processing protease CtpA/Prc